MKTLVVCGGGSAATLSQHGPDARLIAWNDRGRSVLEDAALEYAHIHDVLGREATGSVDDAAIAWAKAWGKRGILDGKSFRDLYTWRGVSLWWFAEIYLFHSTAAPRHVRTIDSMLRLLANEAPDEVEAVGLSDTERVLLQRACTAAGILFAGSARPPLALAWRTRLVSWQSRWNDFKAFIATLKLRLRPPPPIDPPPGGARRILFISHAAFWRPGRNPETGAARIAEHYFDQIIPEVALHPDLEATVVAIGPHTAHRRRGARERLEEWFRLSSDADTFIHVNRYSSWRVYQELRRATTLMRQAWGELRRSAAVAEAFSHRGVNFSDLAEPDLAATMLLQLPWAVRSFEEMREAIDDLRPRAVCLYAESSGWGRAICAACRDAAVPSVAIQHGIIYPRYFSYLHGEDEEDAPIPDRTAVFGEAAKRFLVEQGHYPANSLVVTGSPKFDALVSAAAALDPDVVRARLGVPPGARLLVVASRYRGIRETHQSIGSAFASLVSAVEALDDTHLIVKPHPAERGDEYAAAIAAAGAKRCRVLAGDVDVAQLLHAADALVTVESLSATEALVLGRPVVILNMPTNLAEMVENGVAVGVDAGDDPGPALASVLENAETKARLEEARRRYLSDLARGVDGRATARIVDLLRDISAQRAAW